MEKGAKRAALPAVDIIPAEIPTGEVRYKTYTEPKHEYERSMTYERQ